MAETPYGESTKVALYGAVGTRKTLQIGHLIETFGAENVGIVSCEHGLGTIKSLINPDGVYGINEENAKESPLVGFRNGWAWAEKAYNRPDAWVCVDGGSRVIQWLQDEIVGGTDRCMEAMIGGLSKTDLPADLRKFARFVTKDLDINGQAQWIALANATQQMLNAWMRLRCSMYWTFWEEQTSLDQYKKGLPWRPDCPGKGSLDAILGSFDFIFRLHYEGKVPEGGVNAGCDVASKVYRAKVRDDWRSGAQVPKEIQGFNLAEFVKQYLTAKGVK